jgi:hypothetical protein
MWLRQQAANPCITSLLRLLPEAAELTESYGSSLYLLEAVRLAIVPGSSKSSDGPRK